MTRLSHPHMISLITVLAVFLCTTLPVQAQMDAAVAAGAKMVDRARELGDAAIPTISADDLNGLPAIPPLPSNPVIDKVNEDIQREMGLFEADKTPVPSVLFTDNELARLQEGITVFESGNFVKKMTEGETPVADEVDLDVGIERNLVLAGISFGDGKNWVVWLNKQRLTPSRLPPQIREIHVYKNYVEIRWLDDKTKALIPVRLRPNQRFNLDTQTFLPG